jgi:hypothetical protein
MFQKSEKGMKTPLSVYRVAQGKRYRFRLVGGLCSECPVRVKFEGHQMLVIATDGYPVEPILVDTVVLEAGRHFLKFERNCASAELRLASILLVQYARL